MIVASTIVPWRINMPRSSSIAPTSSNSARVRSCCSRWRAAFAAADVELRRVRLAHHDAALALNALYQRVLPCWHVIGEEPRAIGGADAGHIGQVLDRDRQA